METATKPKFDPLQDVKKCGKINFRNLHFRWKGIKPSEVYSGLLIDEALKQISMLEDYHYPLAEIGTGCGAIAICISKKFPRLRILATDIDEKQVKIAHDNAQRNGCHNISFYAGDMFQPITPQAPFSIVVGNLPLKATFGKKITDTHRDAGPHGSEKIIKFLKESKKYLVGGGIALTVANDLLFQEIKRAIPDLKIMRWSEDIIPQGETLEYFKKLARKLKINFQKTYRTAVISLSV